MAMPFPPFPTPFNGPFLLSFSPHLTTALHLLPLSFFSPPPLYPVSNMKLLSQLNPKHLFRSKKNRSSSVSRSDPQSFGSGSSSSSSDGSNLRHSNSTPTSVLPSNSPFFSSNPLDQGDWTSGFSTETHFELVQAFKLIDIDGDGKISRSELQTVLERVGAEPPNEEELSIMFREVDTDGDGCISLEEFSAMSSAFETPAVGNELRDAFDFFDADRDGKISAEELLGVFMAIGDSQCTLEDCKRMITSVDCNCDGFVCYEDFSKMMERQR